MKFSPHIRRLLRGKRLLYARSSYAIASLFLAGLVAWITIAWISAQRTNQTLTIYSGQERGIYLRVAKEIATQVSTSFPKVTVVAEETEGSLQNLKKVIGDESGTRLAIVQNDVWIDRLSHANVRSLLPLHSGALHILVPKESPIQFISQLRGKVIATGAEGSGSPPVLRALLKYYELEGTVDQRYLSLDEACNALKEREVDALILAMGLKSEAIEELVAEGNVKFVGIGDNIGPGSEIEGFRLTYPFVETTMIPKYLYAPPSNGRGGIPEKGIPAISLRAILIANQSMSSHDAERITRSLVENRAALAHGHPSAAGISSEFDPESLQFPVHRGANRYHHRNDPGFLRENAELFGFLLSLALALGGFFLTFGKWITIRKKDRIDQFYTRLDNLLAQLRGSDYSAEELRELDEKLWNMNRQAVRLLASEKLLANESFRIFQASLIEGRNEIRRRLEK